MLYPTLPSSEDIAEQIILPACSCQDVKCGILIIEAMTCFWGADLPCDANSARGRSSAHLSQVPVPLYLHWPPISLTFDFVWASCFCKHLLAAEGITSQRSLLLLLCKKRENTPVLWFFLWRMIFFHVHCLMLCSINSSVLWFCLYMCGLTSLPVVWRWSRDKLLSLFTPTLVYQRRCLKG